MTLETDHNEQIIFGTECDLHHFHPKDTKLVVLEFLKQAKEAQYRSIRLVHGKGKSVKKKQAHAILDSHPNVESYNDDSYNWGATIIHLKK